jgi:hypothetical protein
MILSNKTLYCQHRFYWLRHLVDEMDLANRRAAEITPQGRRRKTKCKVSELDPIAAKVKLPNSNMAYRF